MNRATPTVIVRQDRDHVHVFAGFPPAGHETNKGIDCFCEPEIVRPIKGDAVRVYVHEKVF